MPYPSSRSFLLLSFSALIAATISSPGTLAADESYDAGKKWQQTLKQGVDALDTNRYWIAEPLLKQAVIDAGKFGPEDLRLARAMGELGRLYSVRGRFSDAEPLLEEELYIKEQVFDTESAELVPAMASMCRFYLNHSEGTKADQLSKKILEIVEGKLGASSHRPKTKVSRQNGELVLEAWAATAAEVARDPFLEWAIACDSVGNVYLSQKNFEPAERMFKAALEVKETVYGRKHLSLANSYDYLGSLALAKKDLFTAESHLKDAYEITRKVLPPSSPQVYGRLDKLAKCYITAGKKDEAQKLYVDAQSFWKDEPSKSGDHIRAMYALGNMYCEEKNYAAAEPILQRAMLAAEEFHGSCSESVVPYIQRYAYVLYYLGRKTESDELKARAGSITGTLLIAEKSTS